MNEENFQEETMIYIAICDDQIHQIERIKKCIENHRKVLFMHKEKFSNFSKKDFNNIKMLYNSTGSWKKYAQIKVNI